VVTQQLLGENAGTNVTADAIRMATIARRDAHPQMQKCNTGDGTTA